jgi:hypothetical protein
MRNERTPSGRSSITMWYNVKPEGEASNSNQRKHGRVRCQGIYCSFGEILDMSASGMRVLSAIRPPPVDKIVTVTIQTLEGPVAVEARVIWSRKTSFFKREIGMRFIDLLPQRRICVVSYGVGLCPQRERPPGCREVPPLLVSLTLQPTRRRSGR